jgi:glycerol-3-phosphate dehydrogenase
VCTTDFTDVSNERCLWQEAPLKQPTKLWDVFTGEELEIKIKDGIHDMGPLSNSLLTLVDPAHRPIVAPSSGTHIILPSHYAHRYGLIEPATSADRIISVLPWVDGVVAGTTDTSISPQMTATTEGGRDQLNPGEVAKSFGTEIDVRRFECVDRSEAACE